MVEHQYLFIYEIIVLYIWLCNYYYYKGPTDLGVKKGKFSGVIKGRFYVITSLSDSWEAFTPLHAGVTLGRFLH